ncbi:MAG: formate dehydrogenase accessory sulfurtransferase FdhD [Mariniblastus sp.]|nr:formate dehydrogenase accessory sulfurtransferase FdhD [Mariniblastus sp.]
MSQPSESEREFRIRQVTRSGQEERDDCLAVEEPMEIRIVFGPSERRTGRSLSITMRTPDHDFELAAGFLLTEGIVTRREQISGFEFCGQTAEGRARPNIVRVELAPDLDVQMQNLQRHFYTTSSCGICGKGSLDAIRSSGIRPVDSSLTIPADTIYKLPDRLREAQSVFQQTGGIHAAGLFDAGGELLNQREDVGRHNALDKLIGNQLLADQLPLAEHLLVVSGRSSFELVQKAATAGFPVMISVGAPSSLAVDLAAEFGITLVGFTSRERFNVYTHAHRIGPHG